MSSSGLLAAIKQAGDNTASQSMAFDNYIEENPEWAFRVDNNFRQIFLEMDNGAVASSWVDKLADECAASSLDCLWLFIKSNRAHSNNGATQSSLCDTMFPFMDKSNDIEKLIASFDNEATRMSLTSSWEDDAGSELEGTPGAPVLLGGMDIVSKAYADLMKSLRAVGNCREGYEWKKGNYSPPCDKCAGEE